MYPDIETLLLDWLEATYPELAPGPLGRRVDTETPANLQQLLADDGVVVRVGLLAGRDDGVTDYSVVDVDVFADSRATAYAWAVGIRSQVTSGPHRVGSAVIDRVVTEEKPRRLPWEDENIWRFGATYRISARR